MPAERRVYKYATGEPIPDGAVYLNTVTQTSIDASQPREDAPFEIFWSPCWLVWHYFLVEVQVSP